MQRRLFVSFVVLVLVATLSPSVFAQRRGGNSSGSHASAPRSSGGSRSAGRTASGGRSYGTSTPRTYDGSQRSYGYAGGRRSGYLSGYGRSYARPFLGRLYYRRGDWYGYYGYGGLFMSIYDSMAWSSFARYATPAGAGWVFNQPLPYNYAVQPQVAAYNDDDLDDYDQEEEQDNHPVRQMVYQPTRFVGASASNTVPQQPAYQPPTQGGMIAQPSQVAVSMPPARQAVQSSSPSRMEIEEACKKDGNMPVRNDTGVKVRATSTSSKGTFEFNAGDSACVEYKDGAQMHYKRIDYYGNQRVDGDLLMADSPICLERDDHEVLHLRNKCQQTPVPKMGQ